MAKRKTAQEPNENKLNEIRGSMDQAFYLSLVSVRTARHGLFYSKEETEAVFSTINSLICEAADTFNELFPALEENA